MTKTIVITGGSRGIGAATARLAGKRGWSVALSYAGNEKAAKETVAAVIAAGGKAIAVKSNAADEAEVIALFDAAEKAFGPIDGLVNNAGTIGSVASPLADITLERMRATIDVNLIGALLAAREAVRRMAKSRGGRGGAIVNVSSAAAKLGSPGEYLDYAASKGGVELMTIGLAKEVGREGIRVNALRPGIIETGFHTTGGQPDRAGRLGGTVPLGRSGSADEVGEAIVWLLSDEASYVTGAILDVTGGR